MRYFKHKKGGIYCLKHEAVHTETGEELCIYMNIHTYKWYARPKKMFFDGRFRELKIEQKERLLMEFNPTLAGL